MAFLHFVKVVRDVFNDKRCSEAKLLQVYLNGFHDLHDISTSGYYEGEKTFTIEIKKRLLLRCIHHFKSDLINNMDHMRISGTKPSSVILSQTK